MGTLFREALVPLSKAHTTVNFPVSPATLWRWALRGRQGVVLQTMLVGGRRYTSREAIDRFVAGCNETRGEVTPTPARAREKADAAKQAAAIF